MDTATQSNYAVISSEHIHLAWKIEWDAQLVTGTVTHSMIAHASTNEVVFDTSFLTINSVHVKGGGALHYDLGERHDVMGSALNVKLGGVIEKGDRIDIIIEYSTTKDCTALGWLTSGEYPFLYSQCQAIHARSLVRESFGSKCYAQSLILRSIISAIADTPAIKLSYSAEVKSTLPILMSGLRISPPQTDQGKIDQSVEITVSPLVPQTRTN
jgi:leukotriene-A4 hydrolase